MVAVAVELTPAKSVAALAKFSQIAAGSRDQEPVKSAILVTSARWWPGTGSAGRTGGPEIAVVIGGMKLKHKVVGIGCKSYETGTRFRADADFVILSGQVLNTLKIEAFDDSFIAKMILSAASRSLDGGAFFAVDLS